MIWQLSYQWWEQLDSILSPVVFSVSHASVRPPASADKSEMKKSNQPMILSFAIFEHSTIAGPTITILLSEHQSPQWCSLCNLKSSVLIFICFLIHCPPIFICYPDSFRLVIFVYFVHLQSSRKVRSGNCLFGRFHLWLILKRCIMEIIMEHLYTFFC